MQEYPGGVNRGMNAQNGGYALLTPHKGFQVEIAGGVEDSPTSQYTIMRSPLYGDHMFSVDMTLGPFTGYGELINKSVRSTVYGRSLDISQLTKLESSSTIANAQDFYRAQTLELVHVYAEVIKNAKEIQLTEEQIMEHVANQLWEDLLHYMLSHGLEVLFQGWNSQQLLSTTMGGLIIPAAVPEMVDTPFMRSLNRKNGTFDMSAPLDCISAKKEDGLPPGLDFDKFHYTMTEAALWFSDYDDPEIHDLILRSSRPDAIDITADGRLYFKDPDVGLFFSKMYLLLTTGHWNDVMQRLQVFAGNQAYILSIVTRILRSMKTDDGHAIDSGETMNPEDYAYGIDSDLDNALKEMVCKGHEYANILQELLKTVGMQERNRMINSKRRVYAQYLKDPHATEYPNATGALGKDAGYNQDFGPPSPYFEIKVQKYNKSQGPRGVMPVLTKNTSRFVLDTLKVRSIDPLVVGKGGRLMRLSEQNTKYGIILRQHEVVHKTPVSVRLMLNPDYTRLLKEGYETTTNAFATLMERPHMSIDKMRQLVQGSSRRAKAVATERGVLVER